MRPSWKPNRGWVLAWVVITLAGAAALGRLELTDLRDGFDTNARIMHRLLSQRVVQHDAILATLALLQAGPDGPADAAPEQRLPALYPQILSVQRRDRGAAWADPVLGLAEIASRTQKRAMLGTVDFGAGRYQLLLAASPASYALTIDLRAMVPWAEWPLPPATSPVRVTLEQAGQSFVLQPGQPAGGGWRFEFHKHLAADSQPFDVVVTQTVGWTALPWGRIILWALFVAAVLASLRHGLRQRAARSRAEELLRLGQVARLNTLGELAAGMAHELNQPLTAVMANTQAARRLLDDDPPELDTARQAMVQAVEQARRASDVVGRLRRVVERPDLAGQTQAVNLAEAVRRALYLLEPECQRRGVTAVVHATEGVTVRAEPVALDQIVHNLLMNALQALEKAPPGQRRLTLAVSAHGARGQLDVADTGPGIAHEVLPRIFEPFFSTREGGLGLGLSLCETLATNMGGSLTAAPNEPHGAVFALSLPLAGETP
jgi:signal transduction histidine kinase